MARPRVVGAIPGYVMRIYRRHAGGVDVVQFPKRQVEMLALSDGSILVRANGARGLRVRPKITGKIEGRVSKVEYQRPAGQSNEAGIYFHDYNKSRVELLETSDGSVLLRAANGGPIWAAEGDEKKVGE